MPPRLRAERLLPPTADAGFRHDAITPRHTQSNLSYTHHKQSSPVHVVMPIAIILCLFSTMSRYVIVTPDASALLELREAVAARCVDTMPPCQRWSMRYDFRCA